MSLGGRFKVNINDDGVDYYWKKSKKSLHHYKQSKGNECLCEQNSINSFNKIQKKIDYNISQDNYEIIHRLTNFYKYRKVAFIGLIISLIGCIVIPWMWTLSILLIIGLILIYVIGCIKLDYEIEDEQKSILDNRMSIFSNIINSKRVWTVVSKNEIVNLMAINSKKQSTIKRERCFSRIKAPYPIKTNVEVVSLKKGKEKLLFLPDKLLLIQQDKVLSYKYVDVVISLSKLNFVELKKIPMDAKVIDYTWKYIDRLGKPDKRFAENNKIPICLYGKISICLPNGKNIIIIFSNIQNL